MNLGCPVVRRASALFPSVCVLAFLSACGSSSPAAISPHTAATLHRDVQHIQRAAAGHRGQTAHAAVDALRRDISRLAAQGGLAGADAHVLMIEAAQVDSRIAIEVKAVSTPATTQPSPVPSSTTTPVPPAAPPSNAKGKGKGKEKGGKGKKHGHGHGGH